MDAPLIFSALALGFASGFHCIGMCGPIALSLGLSGAKAGRLVFKNLAYQLGRIFTYALLGALLGILGKGFELAGLQSYLTIFSGAVLILMAALSFGGQDFVTKIPQVSGVLVKVKIALGRQLQKTGYSSRFLTGVLNGLLPCGMVYMALTASLAAGGIAGGALYMLLFGLGTLPFMFAVALAGGMISKNFRTAVLKIIPVIMFLLGGLFILRGLELGIPYISPKPEALQIQHDRDEAGKTQGHSCH